MSKVQEQPNRNTGSGRINSNGVKRVWMPSADWFGLR